MSSKHWPSLGAFVELRKMTVNRLKLSVASSRVNFENETAVSETSVLRLQVMWDMTPRRFFSSYFVMSVCPCVCPSVWNHSAPTGRIFMKFDIE